MSDLPYLSLLGPEEQRAAVALAEAIVPGSRTVRPADENTVAYVARVAHDVAPALVSVFAKLCRFVDAAARARTGRRFADLDADAQQRLLDRWYEDPVMRGPVAAVSYAVKFMHFDTGRGLAAGGPKRVSVPKLEPIPWASQLQDGDALESEEVECEVVVVGTGAGGAVVGKELADRGLAVVFVEEGDHWRRDSVTGSSIDAHYKYYRGAMALGPSPFPVFMGRMVGGSTAINGGTCFRTPPWILEGWCERIGTDAFTEDKLRPHFERVERTLGVGAPDPRLVGPGKDIIERGCRNLGWSNGPVMRNATACEGAGFCDFGCPTDARRSTNLSYIPPALKKGALCLTGLRVDRVLVEDGRAVGVSAISKRGRRVRVRADAVVLAAGAILTPALLLRQGIANSSGQLGRNLSLHPSTSMAALMDDVVRQPKMMPQGWQVTEFLREGILITNGQTDENFAALQFSYYGRRLMRVLDQFDHMLGLAILVRDDAQQGRVLGDALGHATVQYVPTRHDIDRIQTALVRGGELAFAAGAREVYLTLPGVLPIRSRDELARFAKTKIAAAQTQNISYHPLGTARMGRDPKTSVIGLDHQTHDVAGLFLCDGSAVPGPLGVNPQVTIMTMATRAAAFVADHVAGRAREHEERVPASSVQPSTANTGA